MCAGNPLLNSVERVGDGAGSVCSRGDDLMAAFPLRGIDGFLETDGKEICGPTHWLEAAVETDEVLNVADLFERYD